jgi:hypothetical protein
MASLSACTNDLKSQLFQAQADLSRERQSRDDVQMLSEHNLALRSLTCSSSNFLLSPASASSDLLFSSRFLRFAASREMPCAPNRLNSNGKPRTSRICSRIKDLRTRRPEIACCRGVPQVNSSRTQRFSFLPRASERHFEEQRSRSTGSREPQESARE